MNKILESVSVTQTPPGASNRDIAIAVIAEKLGIEPGKVTDDTDLGDAWHQIGMVVAIKTGEAIISFEGMKASRIFSQL